MKNLYKYLQESLSFDMKLNETSLLDDIDDLEKESDNLVNITNTIGHNYKIQSITDYDGVSKLIKLNKSLIKNKGIKLHQYQTDFSFYQPFKGVVKTSKPTNNILLLGNIVLGLNRELLNNITGDKTPITNQNAPTLYNILRDNILNPEVYISGDNSSIYLSIYKTSKSVYDMGLVIKFVKK